MDSARGGMWLQEDDNVSNMHTSVRGSGVMPSQLVGQGPASTIADAANTIHEFDENATNEAMVQLLYEIIDYLESLALKVEIAKRGSTTTGLHTLDNPHAEGEALLEVVHELEKNNWTLPTIVNTSPTLRHADFKSGLLDPMSYPDSLNGVAEVLLRGTVIDSEDIDEYREFLLLLAGDLLAI